MLEHLMKNPNCHPSAADGVASASPSAESRDPLPAVKSGQCHAGFFNALFMFSFYADHISDAGQTENSSEAHSFRAECGRTIAGG